MLIFAIVIISIYFQMLNIRRALQLLGPGLITAALIFGPSKMTITSKLGAQYGYELLWIIAVTVFFMTVFSILSTRLGDRLERSLLTVIAEKWDRSWARLTGLGIFIVCASFQAGNCIGVGISLGELTATPAWLWILLINLASMALIYWRNNYKLLEQVMIGLILLMLGCFIITFFIVHPPLADMRKGLNPHFPAGSLKLVIAFGASSISIAAAFYQTYLVQEKRRRELDNVKTKYKGIAGILILGLMSAIVMMCAAAVLHPQQLPVNTATDMSKALEPVFGSLATYLFLTGLFGASLSSLIGNASLGGTMLSDALGFGHRMEARRTKYLVMLVMAVGAVVAWLFGKVPLELIVVAQSVTVFVIPFIALAMYLIARDQQLMGGKTLPLWLSGSTLAGIILIIVMALFNIHALLWS